MLSSFGTGGAIAGGVIAIGAAFFTMGQKASEAFNNAKSEAAKLDAELAQIAAGTLPEMEGGIIKIDAATKHWTDELQNLSGLAIGANIADIFGGPGVEERIQLAADMLNKLGTQRVTMANNMLDLSQKELAIEVARANNEEDKADYLQRELDLAREYAKIQNLPLPRNVRKELQDNAYNKDFAKAQQEQNKKDEAAAKKAEAAAQAKAKKIENAQERLAEAKKESSMEEMTREEKIAALRQEMADIQPDKNDELSKIEAETKRLEIQKEISRLVKEDKKEKEAASKNAADEARKVAEQSKKRNYERELFASELEVLRRRAAGQDKHADNLEREIRIEAQARKIHEATRWSIEQSRKSARKAADLEDKIERRRSGKAAHIGGVKNRHYMPGADPNKTDHGLDQFYRNQRKRELRPGEKPPPGVKPGGLVPEFDDSLSGRGRADRRGRWMGGSDPGSIAWRASEAVNNKDAAAVQSGFVDELGQVIKILNDIADLLK
ncbi:hypothetical protein [Prosthecobacter sp.]|uniref:hypothetical protein n=1 Tax=Prosthecobacter sp. TaxID=1965333 RepID=UPI0037844713